MNDLIVTPRHADLIYDVGMHKGEDADFYLRKGFRVVGFEADPDLAAFCGKRFREYIAREKLTIIEGAILDPDTPGGTATEVPFYKNEKNSVWGTVDLNWAERNAASGAPFTTIKVGAVDFAGVLRRHGIPHYMKIDIEGGDMACLKALKLFEERPDYLSLESDKTSLSKIVREIDTLTTLGYDAFQAVDQSVIPSSQSPPNPPKEGAFAKHRFEEGSSGLFGAELPGRWKSKSAILRQYRTIMLGYHLLGDAGVMNQWKFRGAWRLQSVTRACLGLFKKGIFPGWYDTHARHSRAK